MAQSEKTHPNRRYKDSFFVSLFSEEEQALRLYSAITGRKYGADTRIAVKTLSDIFIETSKTTLLFCSMTG